MGNINMFIARHESMINPLDRSCPCRSGSGPSDRITPAISTFYWVFPCPGFTQLFTEIHRKSTDPGQTENPLNLTVQRVLLCQSGGIPLRAATDMVATPHCGACFLSVEKGTDEIPRSAGRQFLSPRPFQVRVFDSQHSG